MSSNVFKAPVITPSHFQGVVTDLVRQHGRLTGAVVQRIRNDWENLGVWGSKKHPATPEAQAAYRSFVRQYGALALLDLLSGNIARA